MAKEEEYEEFRDEDFDLMEDDAFSDSEEEKSVQESKSKKVKSSYKVVESVKKISTSEEKLKAIQSVMAKLEKTYGKGSIMNMGNEDSIEPVEVIPTGSMLLDLALGVGGYPRGRIIEIFGPEGSGKATLYVNGKKIAESGWAGSTFDIAPEMYIGKVAGFMWGERPFVGQMSEVRLWNVPRTESQLEKNMLSVAPDSEGLVAYYHLNGEDLTQDEKGQFVITDASGHGMDGLMNGGDGMYRIASLEEPIEIK